MLFHWNLKSTSYYLRKNTSHHSMNHFGFNVNNKLLSNFFWKHSRSILLYCTQAHLPTHVCTSGSNAWAHCVHYSMWLQIRSRVFCLWSSQTVPFNHCQFIPEDTLVPLGNGRMHQFEVKRQQNSRALAGLVAYIHNAAARFIGSRNCVVAFFCRSKKTTTDLETKRGKNISLSSIL